jgi:putative transposase
MSESEYIHKSHNVSVLLYHFVCPAKYRKVVFDRAVDTTLKDVCLEIEKRYEVHFLEIGTDKNHVHFLIQSVPNKSPTQIIRMLKSITAREIFRLHPEVKKQLWGGEFWTDGYFVNTVSKFGDESTISKYVREQGVEKDYTVLHKAKQLDLFSDTP